MERRRTTPLLNVRRPDYSPLGLKRNPFPLAALARPKSSYPLIDPDLDEAVRRFIAETLVGEEYGGLVVLGEFGSGKTYALRYIETLLKSTDRTPDVEDVLALYVERPMASLMDLVRKVCDSIGRTRVRSLLLEMVLTDMAVELKQAPDSEPAKKLKEAYSVSKSSELFVEGDLLERLSEPEFLMNPAMMLGLVEASGGDLSFATDFAQGSLRRLLGAEDGRTFDVARHLAEFALAPDVKAVKLWDNLLRGRLNAGGEISAQEVWSSVRTVLGHAGYRMIYWLIDEFEELAESSLRKTSLVRSFLADFRDLIDFNLEGFAVVVASKYPAWDTYRELHPPFSQRFGRVATLKPSSLQELRRMVRLRLDNARLEDWHGNELSPFGDEALERIHRISVGNTRVAVETCHILLWHAAETGSPNITPEMVDTSVTIMQSYFYSRLTSRGE